MEIYMTRRNSDFTEGRGPMINDECFLYREDAEKFIDDKPGVMGRKEKWSQCKHGDWDIVPMHVHESLEKMEENLKAIAIENVKKKLTKDELKLLGLE